MLASIVLVSITNLLDFHEAAFLFRVEKRDFAAGLAVFLVTVLVNVNTWSAIRILVCRAHTSLIFCFILCPQCAPSRLLWAQVETALIVGIVFSWVLHFLGAGPSEGPGAPCICGIYGAFPPHSYHALLLAGHGSQ